MGRRPAPWRKRAGKFPFRVDPTLALVRFDWHGVGKKCLAGALARIDQANGLVKQRMIRAMMKVKTA